jgi:hypothetical protein
LTYTGTVQLTQYVYETSDTLAYYHITGSAKVTTPTPYGGVTCTISPSSGPISTNTTAGDLIVNPGPAGTFPADGYTIRWALDWSATFSCVDSSGKQLPDFTIPIPVDYATLDCGAPHYMLYSDINHLAGSLTMCGGNQGTWDLTAQ